MGLDLARQAVRLGGLPGACPGHASLLANEFVQ
jgi:hypothetical protein